MSVHAGQIPVWLQYAWAIAGLVIAVGGVVWIMAVFFPYILWTKKMMLKSYELGERTTDHLARLQKELTPVIDDLKGAVRDARSIVKDLREKDLEKIRKAIDKLSQNGKLEKAFEAIEKIPGKLDEVIKDGRKNVIKNL